MTGAEVGLTTEEYMDEAWYLSADEVDGDWRERVAARWLSIGAPDGTAEVTW